MSAHTHTQAQICLTDIRSVILLVIFHLLQDQRYPVSSKPTGLCVIINNENFAKSKQRLGTNKDAGMFQTYLHDAKDLLVPE